MRFNLIVSSQAVARFTMMSLGGWIRLLEAFKEPAAVFKVKFLTGQKLEKTYSLTRFCLLLCFLPVDIILRSSQQENHSGWNYLISNHPAAVFYYSRNSVSAPHTFNLLWHSTLSQNPCPESPHVIEASWIVHILIFSSLGQHLRYFLLIGRTHGFFDLVTTCPNFPCCWWCLGIQCIYCILSKLQV